MSKEIFLTLPFQRNLMIALGKYNKLTISRKTQDGLLLEDRDGETVLLPNRFCPEFYSLNDELEVFVYANSERQKIATTMEPKAQLNEFVFLKVSAVTKVGTFLNLGLEEKIMVPFREQRQQMEEDRWYVVYIDLDPDTNRLIASNKLEKRLQNDDLTCQEGELVDILVYKLTDLGFAAIINHKHKGLIYKNEIFRKVKVGDQLRAFVKKIREDGKIDLSLQPIGYRKSTGKNSDDIYQKLVDSEGFLPFNDKSDPEAIYKTFGISKKAFKKAVGDLYKQRIIDISREGIRLV